MTSSDRWLRVLVAVLLLVAGAEAVVLATELRSDSPGSASNDADAAPVPSSSAGDEPPPSAAPPASNADQEPPTSTVTEAASPIGAPEGSSIDGVFTATFDGVPASPLPWNPSNWDVTVHSRDVATFDALDHIDAGHGPDCAGPPATHPVTAYEDSVFACRDHVMTSIRGDAYGVIYLTPNQMVDFSERAAVISVDVSTLRTSVRDWWDVWISPYDTSLQLPLELDASADLSGPPKDAIRVGLGTENQITAEIFKDFAAVQFPDYPNGSVTGDTFTGYESFLVPDAARRDTFEIHISENHLKVGMPAYDFWWIDTDIPTLGWDSGVVQFGHHSYNPTKDCNIANTPRPPVSTCLPNTWHWDNVSISPSTPFTIIKANRRAAAATSDTIEFTSPAPAGAKLRFSGIGRDLQVSYDGGDWHDATVQQTGIETPEDHFASYWTDIPEGTTAVRFRATDWYGGPWHVRDATIWHGQSVAA